MGTFQPNPKCDQQKLSNDILEGRVESNYSAPPQNIGYAVKLAIKSWQV